MVWRLLLGLRPGGRGACAGRAVGELLDTEQLLGRASREVLPRGGGGAAGGGPSSRRLQRRTKMLPKVQIDFCALVCYTLQDVFFFGIWLNSSGAVFWKVFHLVQVFNSPIKPPIQRPPKN